MKILMTFALAAMMAGCALPTTEVKIGAARPALAVQGAPAGSSLYLDGLLIGDAAQYDGATRKLMIEEGVHKVEVKHAGTVLVAQQIFASAGETTTIAVALEQAK